MQSEPGLTLVALYYFHLHLHLEGLSSLHQELTTEQSRECISQLDRQLFLDNMSWR